MTEAVLSRRSTRAYLDRPVDPAVLREILATALWAPSGGNLQPWHIHVVEGESRRELSRRIAERIPGSPTGETGDPQIYPASLPSPFTERRAVSAALLFDALHIAREDKPARHAQGLKNFDFFGAPVGLIFTVPSCMVESQAIDLGLLMQTIILLARERQLATVPQACWRMWPETIREVLGLGPDVRVMAGMGLGHADPASPVSHLPVPRERIEHLVTYHR